MKAILILASLSLLAEQGVNSRLFGNSGSCPPAGFTSLPTLNLTAYAFGHRWFSAKQIETSYQPLNQFYCVSAKYTPKTGPCFLCGDAFKVNVFNRALRDSVNGTENSIKLTAFVPDPVARPAEIKVSFFSGRFLPSTNYWIVAAGIYGDLTGVGASQVTYSDYDWAIITTGAPSKQAASGGCYSTGGMWIFSRDPVPPAGAIDQIESIAVGLGLDITTWKLVEQEDCDYSTLD